MRNTAEDRMGRALLLGIISGIASLVFGVFLLGRLFWLW